MIARSEVNAPMLVQFAQGGTVHRFRRGFIIGSTGETVTTPRPLSVFTAITLKHDHNELSLL